MRQPASIATSPKRTVTMLTVLPFALLLLAYLPALRDLIVDWYTDGNYSHGFLVPLVSAYLLWKKRSVLASTSKEVSKWGLIIVLLGLVLFLLANGAAEYFALRLSFVITLFGLVFYVFGKRVIQNSWFELAFLVFMIPIPYVVYFAVTFPMQLLASKVTVAVLNVLGAGAFRQGNIIILAGTSLEVADACSGIRSLMSLLTLGALYAHISQNKVVPKLILIVSTVPIAVLGNVARIFITSMLAYVAGVDVTAEPVHSISGMTVFVVAFLLLFAEAWILKRIRT